MIQSVKFYQNHCKCLCVPAVCDGLLLVYSDIHIDVFEVLSGDWVQTINLKRTKPLMRTGILNMVMISDLPHVAYLRNLHKGKSAVITYSGQTFALTEMLP